jgi:hypothetical protein
VAGGAADAAGGVGGAVRRLTIAAVAAPAVLVGSLLSTTLVFGDQAVAGGCGPAGEGVRVDVATLPGGSVAGYRGEQLVNAALVINAGQALGLNVRAQTIAVMTAMGESSLRVLDRGDAVGPDSRGLFQQRARGWGSYADRMNPTISATNFYKALVRVDGWETLPPTIAAHRTQRNADPFHYTRYWDDAVEVVTALAGVAVSGIAAGTGELACTSSSPGTVSATGWTKPAVGPVTSVYGRRFHPELHIWRLHAGTDIGAGCEAPIWAAAAGTVVQAGPVGGYGNLITIDHGTVPGRPDVRVVTRSAHMHNNGVLVRVGQSIPSAGQQIARVGDAGLATGCHLHFEVLQGGRPIDPQPFMAQVGAPLG